MTRRMTWLRTRARTVTAGGLVVGTLCTGIPDRTILVGRAQDRPAEAVTYTRHIAPILNTHCVQCHRPGAVAPFSLSTYAEVSGRARAIARVTRDRVMPPWKPTSEAGTFLGERRLSEPEIETIQQWVDAGAIEGNQQDLPPAPAWPDGWMRGEPDLVLTMPEPYVVPSGGEDIYRNFVLPIPIDRGRFVKAIELKPDTTRGIHHARIMIDRSGSAGRLDAADPVPGYDNSQVDRAVFPEGHFLGWAPGTLPARVSDDLGWHVEPGSDLVLKTHLVPRGEPTPLEVSAGFFFTDTPPAAIPAVVHLGSQTIDIPPGASNHVVEDSYRLPIDVDVLAVYPHAHFLGKEVEASAVLPDGTTRPLIRIDDWDFAWQDEYRYARPVRLPAGSVVTMRFVFDNSTGNPSNPTSPPRRVRFGPRSTDEMAELMLQVLPVHPSDRPLLARGAAQKVADIVLAGSMKALEDAPDSAVIHERVGNDLVAAGQLRDAVEHLETAVRLDPELATAHYRLGTALALMGRTDEAMDRYRRAIELRPDFVEAHNNLGGLLQLAGAWDEAARHYRQTLDLDPSHANANFNLGSILLADRSFRDAEAAFRGTLEVRPDFPDAHAGLGQALAGQGKPEAAVEAYRAALRLDPSLSEAYRLLGDALAELGRNEEARTAYARARQLETARP